MSSIINFSYNLLTFTLAWIFNIWIESYAYWFFPDAVFLIAIWLQFVSGKINYLALILIALVSDVYLNNTFGSYLIAITLVVYFMGILNYSEQSQSPLLGCALLFLYYLIFTQILLFTNGGLEGILKQFIVFTISKSFATAIAWLIIQSFFNKRKRRLIDL